MTENEFILFWNFLLPLILVGGTLLAFGIVLLAVIRGR